MEKIKVTICTGTSCYVMGGSELLLLEEYLPPELKDEVELEGATCFGFCKDRKNSKPPFVTVNGERIEQATIQSVLERIGELATLAGCNA